MMPRRFAPPARRRSRGITIIELMVGIAAGMLIVAAMSLLFANNSRGRAETERASQKIENGRYAMELGFHVTLVRDATAAFTKEMMHAAHELNGPTYAHAILYTQELIAALPTDRDG